MLPCLPSFPVFRAAVMAGLVLGVVVNGPAASADAWTVDASTSRLTFEGVQAGAAFKGRFEKWSAEIVFDPDDPSAGSVSVDIDMISATTDNAQRDANLPTPNWLDTVAQPSATFKSVTFRKTGPSTFEADGVLTIRGIARNVTLPFELTIDGDLAEMSARTSLRRADFDIGKGVPSEMIGDDVIVGVEMTARRRR